MSNSTEFSLTEPSPIPGMRVVVEGAYGAGKTTALRPLLTLHEQRGWPQPLELFVLDLDPNTAGVFVGTDARICTVRTGAKFDALENLFKKVETGASNETIQTTAFGLSGTRMLSGFLSHFTDFRDNSGKSWGNVGDWGTNRVLVIDGLTGLSKLIAEGNLGLKPAWTQPDYQRVMNCIASFLDYVTQNLWCHLFLVAHVEYEQDDLERRKISPSTVGRKLSSKIGRGFTDIVLASNAEGKFTWTSTHSQADLAARHLPLGEKLPANACTLFTTPRTSAEGPCGWLARGGIVSPVRGKVAG